MVSPLWKAAAEGDLNKIRDLLRDASNVDIEIKDHTGTTPLIQAVKMGHIEVVKVLLEHGADPSNMSSQGRPESYTQDPAILECLATAAHKTANNDVLGMPSGTPPNFQPGEGYPSDQVAPVPTPYDPRYYYMPPPGQDVMYAPYSYMGTPPEGVQPMQGYYPPPPPQQHRPDRAEGNGTPNLPPADVARNIPCRYFPMCKYGPTCLFAHPQPPYFNGPPPPAPHYSPYDPHAPPHSFAPNFYPVPPPHAYQQPPPPPTQQPNGTGLPPPSQVPTSSSPSPLAPPFTPGAPPPVPYNIPSYPAGHTPPLPAPLPQPHMPISPTAQFHPPTMMPSQPPYVPLSPTHHRNGSTVAFPPQAPAPPAGVPQTNGVDDSQSNKQGMGFAEDGAPQRDGGFRARGPFRKPSFGGRKPPCLFFPTGKCRNGDQCRFPHIRPEDDPEAFGPGGFPPNTFPTRYPRHRNPHFGPISEKRDSIHRRDSSHSPTSNGHPNGINGHINGAMNGHVNGNGNINGKHDQNHVVHRAPYQANGRPEKVMRNGFPPPKQRVPNADDFPSLSGASTPTATSALNGFHHGPTAAQVLKGGIQAKDVLNGATDKLEESMAKMGLDDQGSPDRSIRSTSSPELPPPTFATIGAPTPKLQIAAA